MIVSDGQQGAGDTIRVGLGVRVARQILESRVTQSDTPAVRKPLPGCAFAQI